MPNLTRRLEAPTLLIAGSASHVIGEKNIHRAAEVWGARLEWLDAGHFVYFEQPRAFAELIERFVRESAGER
jgi:pimeloyl-ACP methyl ester carboxylesterase